jgi:hypothetical protein
MRGRARAITELVLRIAYDPNRFLPLDVTDACERLAESVDFGFELVRIAKVLELAPAAPAEVLTGRRPPSGTGLQDLDDFGAQEPLATLRNAGTHDIARGCEGNENGLPVESGEAISPVNDLFDLYLNRLIHAR